MAFRAVGPLDGQTDVTLRIQLPDSRTRIKTAAQIVWLSESNRKAGVRFVDFPSEGRAQIQEWIRSQISLKAPSDGIPMRRQIVNEPQVNQENIRSPRKDKWLSMMAKLEASALADKAPPPIAETPEIPSQAPVKQETAATLSASEIMFSRPGERAKPPSEAPRLREDPPDRAPYQPRTEPSPSGPNGHANRQNSGYAANGVPSHHRANNASALELTIPISRDAPPAALNPSTPRSIFAERSASSVYLKTDMPVPAATRRSPAQKWARAGALFALFSILSFSIGTWVGSLRTHVQSVQIPAPSAATVPVANPDASGSNERKANELAPAITNKTRAEHAGGNSEPETLKRNLELPTRPLLDLPVQRNDQSTPAKQSPAPVTAVNQPESLPPPTPVPDDSGAADPAPRIVAGRTLRPTDRFNPCHLTYRVEPTYPLEAQQQRIEGAVKIHLVIGANGAVRSMKLLSGSPLLAPAAMDAANYWQYLPALLNGKPVETDQDIEIDFRLPH